MSAPTSPPSVRTPVTCGGRPGLTTSPRTRTPRRSHTPDSAVVVCSSSQSSVDRRVIKVAIRSSPGQAEVSASVSGMCTDNGASATPAASRPE
jgi:hypothetical protein